jgi:hypothetical protein
MSTNLIVLIVITFIFVCLVVGTPKIKGVITGMPTISTLSGVKKWAFVLIVFVVIVIGCWFIFKSGKPKNELSYDHSSIEYSSDLRDYKLAKDQWSPKLGPDQCTADAVPGRQVRINGQDNHMLDWPAGSKGFKVPSYARFIEVRSTETKIVVTGVPVGN